MTTTTGQTPETHVVEYSSNNSGGSWWLKDTDWKALEDAGWHVEWGGLDFCHSKYGEGFSATNSAPNTCEKNHCDGHRRYASYTEALEGERWLGAIAKGAKKAFPSLKDAIVEWERVTKQDASDEGCNCCGAPHSFSMRDGDKYEYASGDMIADLLLPKAVGLTRRQLAEKLNAAAEGSGNG